MRILLTNDDGIRAPGIVALHDALTGRDSHFDGPIQLGGSPAEVWTCAPETVQSATSHGVTFSEPLMVKPTRVHEGMRGMAVDGRPADCVKLAVSKLWREQFGATSKPDLVVSGMNAGANVGVNVIYSGTVAAAIEAAFLGLPSIAVSLHLGRGRPGYELAARHARRAIEAVLAAGGPASHECININVPRTELGPRAEGDTAPTYEHAPSDPPVDTARLGYDPAEMPPIRVCPMNLHGLVDAYEERRSPAGEQYYWAAGGGLDFHGTDDGSDVDLLLKRCITVTPLSHDLTRHRDLDRWSMGLAGSGR